MMACVVCIAHLGLARDVHEGVGKNCRTLRQCYLAELLFLSAPERTSHPKT